MNRERRKAAQQPPPDETRRRVRLSTAEFIQCRLGLYSLGGRTNWSDTRRRLGRPLANDTHAHTRHLRVCHSSFIHSRWLARSPDIVLHRQITLRPDTGRLTRYCSAGGASNKQHTRPANSLHPLLLATLAQHHHHHRCADYWAHSVGP